MDWDGSGVPTPREEGLGEEMGGNYECWDYKIRKLDIAGNWNSRIIPDAPQPSGVWTEADYIARAQKVMKEAADAVDAVFKDNGGIGISV